MIKTLKPNPFIATSPRTGDANRAALFRGQNMWIRGSSPLFHAEAYAGSLDLNESYTPAPLTGKMTFTAGLTTVLGSGGSAYLTELHIGQFVYSGGELLVVDEIQADDQFSVTRAPSSSRIDQLAYRLPVIQNLDGKRAVFLRGSLLHTEQGNILGVGDGEVFINGKPLQATTLILKRTAQIALIDPTSSDFTVYDLGFTAPAGITVTNSPGGAKNMTPGTRSLRFCKARKQTGGYGNPSDPVSFTITAGDLARIGFPAMDAAEGQNAWYVFGTLYESATSVSAAEGPWYDVAFLDDNAVASGGGNYELEYLNSEISRAQLLSFDNTPPVDAEFIASLIGYPIYISCQGQGNAHATGGTSPGPFIIPAKPNNIEAAPLKFPNPVAVSPLEKIIGFVEGAARIFLMTKNHLNFATFTGNQNFPVTIRPYWKRGFMNPYGLVMIGQEIFGSTTGGIFRSASEADEVVETYNLAADVEELISTYNAGHRLMGYCPQNEAVCVFYPAAYKNGAGYWTTIVLPFLLKQNFWNPPIVLTSDSRDMIVSGVATVGSYLEFVAGGCSVDSPSVPESKTYRFDTVSGESVPWYLAWSYSDEGEEQRTKVVKGVRVTGKTTSASVGIHGSRSSASVDVDALEEGNSASASGPIPVQDSADVAVKSWKRTIVRELLLYTARVEGTWNGTGMKDRIDEIAIEVELGGNRK